MSSKGAGDDAAALETYQRVQIWCEATLLARVERRLDLGEQTFELARMAGPFDTAGCDLGLERGHLLSGRTGIRAGKPVADEEALDAVIDTFLDVELLAECVP